MKTVRNLLLAAVALAAAVPATAQAQRRGGYYPPPPRYYEPAPQNAVRLELGGATLNGVTCDPSYCYDTGNDWSAFMLGGDVDLALGRTGLLNLTVGARELFSGHHSGYPNIFEPNVGLTFKFMRRMPVQPRLTVGAGFLFDSDGDSGASFRFGGGVTLFADAPVGLAIDLVLDVGRLSGYDVTQGQFSIGPEFHF
jgi:hypothetical protein